MRRRRGYKTVWAALLPVVIGCVGRVQEPGETAAGLSAEIALEANPASPGSRSLRSIEIKDTFPSPEAVARRVIELLEAGDAEGLRAMAVSREEFHRVVYPELPASDPKRNTSADFLFGMTDRRSRRDLAFTLSRYAGQRIDLVAVDFLGATTEHRTFRVHRKAALTVRTPDGDRVVVRLFGSMIERDGRYKVFSFVTDG